jgi:hypothetical protein
VTTALTDAPVGEATDVVRQTGGGGLVRSWVPPRAAVGSWLRLQAGIRALVAEGRSPVCASDPGLWWSYRPAEVAEAVAWCECCPLVAACREYAVLAGERHGVWGGLTAEERLAPAAGRSA